MNREEMRLQKFLSRTGVASRREAEKLMAQGRVRVNGEVVAELGSRVDPHSDRIEVDRRLVLLEPPRWIMLNKPRGVLTSRKDPANRRTVYSLLAPADRNLRYVGRLDRDTEGLLLFTNEGDLQHALLHPSTGIPRQYHATVEGIPNAKALRALERGVDLEDGPARAEQVRLIEARDGGGDGVVISLVLREGKKREVRRLLTAVGHSVRRLRRIRFGPVSLEGVSPGEWRMLRPEEIRELHRAAGSPHSATPHDRLTGRTGIP